MNKIEQRISELVNAIRAEGAYCCTLDRVKDMTESASVVRVTMRCQHHKTYSFEVQYSGPGIQPEEQDDSGLMRRIVLGILENISTRPTHN